jgi:ubiquinone/menaquinone biosynthesis C-methylase UbiE
MNDAFFPATTMPDAEWWEALWPDPGRIVTEMGVQPGMTVIDLCCGDGLFTAPLARVADHVYAIDIDPALLDAARARLAATDLSNWEFIVADAMMLDTSVHQSVDYVFLANTFHGVPDQAGLAREVAAKLKPGGQFGIVNWHRRPREENVVFGKPRGPKTEMRMEPADVIDVAETAGLRVERTLELPPFHYGLVLGKRKA